MVLSWVVLKPLVLRHTGEFEVGVGNVAYKIWGQKMPPPVGSCSRSRIFQTEEEYVTYEMNSLMEEPREKEHAARLQESKRDILVVRCHKLKTKE